jgi:ATP adenylyltransferase
MWAPWRYGYLVGDDPIEGCPFCVIPARGPQRDRESLILARGEHTFVIFNAYPYNPGHLMVVPYGHVADLEDLDEPTAAEMWGFARRAVSVLKERVHAQGVNLGMNLGAAGGRGDRRTRPPARRPTLGRRHQLHQHRGGVPGPAQALEEVYDVVAPGFA